MNNSVLSSYDPNAPHLLVRRQHFEGWAGEGLRSCQSLSAELDHAASSAPDRKFVFWSADGRSQLTFEDLRKRSIQAAGALARYGFSAGDVMVMQLPHCAEGALLFFGAMHLGMVVVPVINIYGPTELGFIMRESRAKVLAVPSVWRQVNYAERIEAIGRLPDLERIVVLGDEPFPGPSVAWSKFIRHDARTPVRHQASPDDVCALLYTSGTTSAPKGVLHTHRTLIGEASSFRAQMGRGAEGTYFNPMPAGHMSGLLTLLRPLINRFDMVAMDVWRPDDLDELNASCSVRTMTVSPFHLFNLTQLKRAPRFPDLDLIVAGGATSSPSLIMKANEIGLPAGRTYGSTEHPSISTARAEDTLYQRAHTDGRLNPGASVRIVDDDDRPVNPGEPGNILSMGPDLFVGYTDARLNSSSFTGDGWFRTGDIGTLDEHGYLTIVDRKKDLIIRGGENISSKEVEDIVVQNSKVIAAAAVAWPDPAYGERVGLFVQLKAEACLTLEEVQKQFIQAGVARQKTPERIVVIDEFPRDAMGKILKRDLRQRARELDELEKKSS